MVPIDTFLFASQQNNREQIQDTEAAVKYFQNELNFTANPGTVKKLFEVNLMKLLLI